jgi:hypothetical protein
MLTPWGPRSGAVGAAFACIAIAVGTSGCHMLFAGTFVLIGPSTYTPGTIGAGLSRASHVERTVGDVDVAMRLLQESERTVLEWRMGNGSTQPVGTDLSVLVVTAKDAAGGSTRVPLVDPAGEIGPRPLAARRQALERIALHIPASAERVCVTWKGAIAAPAEPSPACFTRASDSSPTGWLVDAGGAT